MKKAPVRILIMCISRNQQGGRAVAGYPPILSRPTGFTMYSIKKGGIQGYRDMQRSLEMRADAWPRASVTASDQTESQHRRHIL